MRIITLNTSLALLGISIGQASAFTLQSHPFRTTQQASSFSSSKTSLHMALTSKDILARARKAVGAPEEEDEEAPKIFEDDVLDGMQNTLLLLEKRVKNGPRSLSHDEIQSLDQLTKKIIQDMNAFESSGAAAAAVQPAPPVQAQVPLQPQQQVQREPQKTLTDLPPAAGPLDPEYNPEEGSAYVGKGGLGLAAGTTNTWVIDGMDEMTGEEYRQALQEQVSARQSMRRSDGTTGNLSSNNYLDNL